MNTHDALDECLGPRENGTAALRESLRTLTSKAVRRRRWHRRLTLALAASLLFMAGMGTMAWLRPPPQGQPNALLPLDIEQKAPPAPRQQEPERLSSPAPKKAESLLSAGKQYLERENDIASALRCYRQALESGEDRLLEISPDDDWLVMALKLDRQKEN